ncbi:hypothetical protein IHV09_14115 [Fictibacillus sp. 23RED33]|uniref:hypothetical protein n=1 Tax=Fictibacillus sp. 23RED33 TaxID=2745879 RepID=UPI0018CEEAFB|nr:hypothetical protein [Fictibacillus sp. 23RED33]MBH0174699.1 hypothetical protein [Fictibacillus sp. 23RED33]
MENFIMKCLKEQRPIEIIYLADSGSISQRTIKVIEIRNATLKAYCHLRKTQRVFKIGNILSINYKTAAS